MKEALYPLRTIDFFYMLTSLINYLIYDYYQIIKVDALLFYSLYYTQLMVYLLLNKGKYKLHKWLRSMMVNIELFQGKKECIIPS